MLFIANVVLNWGRSVSDSLIGRWLDLYLMITPPVTRGEAVLPRMGFGMMLGAFGLFGPAWFHRRPRIRVREPLLARSLSYDN